MAEHRFPDPCGAQTPEEKVKLEQFIPIHYRDFWDVPRVFFVDHQTRTYLFDCAFDDKLEDFRSEYQVYRMPTDFQIPTGSWMHLDEIGTHLGSVPVQHLEFDPTKRQSVSVASIESLLQLTFQPSLSDNSAIATELPTGAK